MGEKSKKSIQDTFCSGSENEGDGVGVGGDVEEVGRGRGAR